MLEAMSLGGTVSSSHHGHLKAGNGDDCSGCYQNSNKQSQNLWNVKITSKYTGHSYDLKHGSM